MSIAKSTIIQVLSESIGSKVDESEISAIADKLSTISTTREIAFYKTGTKDIVFVNYDDILFAQKPKTRGKYTVYTLYGSYEQLHPGWGFISDIFDPSIFLIADSNCVFRMDKVKKYDSRTCRFYFEDEIRSNSIYVETFYNKMSKFIEQHCRHLEDIAKKDGPTSPSSSFFKSVQTRL